MSSPDTGTRMMTDQQVQLLLERITAMQGAGAKIHVTDRRLSALQSGLLSVGGLIFLGICTWGVLKITTLSEVMQQVVTQNGWIIEQLKDHEVRLRDQERAP
jgi:hypothetical protein